MEIVCLDLEGVLVPEIWINVAKKTGVRELEATTRDVANYDDLMKQRLRIINEHNFDLSVIQDVINELNPFEGARDFLNNLREHFQVIILSDTFYEFATPLMKKLGYPTLFCHRLETNSEGKIINYHLRMPDHKREAVKALHGIYYTVYAAGDSFNDTSMLAEADYGFLFRAPENIIKQFPQFPAIQTYQNLQIELENLSPRF